ncbi:hypothetical protein NIE88_07905 [Sporolactobacillus shoreicorticis]|uniref:DUF2515 domain-containing protein n=1 Tax=Sporolactobacillus shoreicorticis TaxID=1923877 RepID=A0ABW5S7W0_9BACL|nr:hypothetical protein [Sporolactobacillus shoreicorticis]MCO7125692.1 hypothetical protein [Sporolactobacillus shoreicorticis]
MSAEKQQNNPLNKLRRQQPDTLINEWNQLCQNDQEKAFTMINDPGLEFPVLFMLRDQIETRGEELTARARIALAQIRNVLHGADLGNNHPASFADQHDEVVESMYWILNTGWKNIVSTDYTQVIDQTAINLLHTYHENWLKGMVDLVIYRYKNKSQRHYLISAMWETANPLCLVYLSNYFLSDQSVESNYARKMLAFIPEVRHSLDNQSALLAFETWYEENAHYLVYTGETNDAVPGGRPYRIHYSAKYLGKTVSPRSGEPIQALLPNEKKNYFDFLKLPPRLQTSLSAYSIRLRKQQPKIWRSWVIQPLNEQLQSINTAAHGGYYL